MSTPAIAVRHLRADAKRPAPASACRTDTETAPARSNAYWNAREDEPHRAEEKRARKNRGGPAAALRPHFHSKTPRAIEIVRAHRHAEVREQLRELGRDRSVRPTPEMFRSGRSFRAQAASQRAQMLHPQRSLFRGPSRNFAGKTQRPHRSAESPW